MLLANFLSLLTFGLLFTGFIISLLELLLLPMLFWHKIHNHLMIHWTDADLLPGLMPTQYSSIKCSLVLTMVYFSLYLNLITEFIRSSRLPQPAKSKWWEDIFRILDCYIAIVFPFSHQLWVTQENSLGENHMIIFMRIISISIIIRMVNTLSSAVGSCCWFIGLFMSASFYFTGYAK